MSCLVLYFWSIAYDSEVTDPGVAVDIVILLNDHIDRLSFKKLGLYHRYELPKILIKEASYCGQKSMQRSAIEQGAESKRLSAHHNWDTDIIPPSPRFQEYQNVRARALKLVLWNVFLIWRGYHNHELRAAVPGQKPHKIKPTKLCHTWAKWDQVP